MLPQCTGEYKKPEIDDWQNGILLIRIVSRSSVDVVGNLDKSGVRRGVPTAATLFASPLTRRRSRCARSGGFTPLAA